MAERYDERALKLLMDKYERSLLYTGENQRNQSISVSIQKRNFPEYFRESSMEYDVLHQQMLELEAKNWICLHWKGKKIGHILEKVSLQTEKAGEINAFLGRRSRLDKETVFREILKEYKGRGTITDLFLEFLEERLSKGEGFLGYASLEEPKVLKELLRLSCEIENNKEELFLREFSVRFFQDSKLAEKRIGSAARILRDFSPGDSLKGCGTEEVLEEFEIYKNPSVLMLKGRGEFSVEETEERLKLKTFPHGIGLVSQDIPAVMWKEEIRPRRVVTIENLTSFHRMEAGEDLLIYLGGYHNRVKREFLKKIYRTFGGNTAFLHFGDLDCGGFKIWKDLCTKTEIPFQTLCMDLETYRRYKGFGRVLTENDRKELRKMQEDPFFSEQLPLFQEMQKEGVKLEQEIVR